jgi:hypothetical protein
MCSKRRLPPPNLPRRHSHSHLRHRSPIHSHLSTVTHPRLVSSHSLTPPVPPSKFHLLGALSSPTHPHHTTPSYPLTHIATALWNSDRGLCVPTRHDETLLRPRAYTPHSTRAVLLRDSSRKRDVLCAVTPHPASSPPASPHKEHSPSLPNLRQGGLMWGTLSAQCSVNLRYIFQKKGCNRSHLE